MIDQSTRAERASPGMIVRAPSIAGRRLFIGALLGLGALVVWPAQAWAGSYLDRAALLLSEATREADYLRRRLSDKELARTVHKLAEARAKAAATMDVPKEVADAHPHLLLTLETYERAADAAQRGQGVKFLELVQRARDEENIFRGILKQNGWTLPDG